MKRSMPADELEISGEVSGENLKASKKLRSEVAGDGEEEERDCEIGFADVDEKRSIAGEPESSGKNLRLEFDGDGEEGEERENENGFAKLDENLLYEVFKHADARTLAVASSVNKMWHRTAEDERLWELICTRHYANINCGAERLRSVVLALGGFRRLHALYLSKTASPAPAIHAPARVPAVMVPQVKGNKRWGKDEVHLSLSLLSIRYYEKMNFANRNSK